MLSAFGMLKSFTAEELVNALKAAGETTRLRLLLLLAESELNVKDLTRILGQSQPRISRHLKLMLEAGLVERFREGSWVYFRLSENNASRQILRAIFDILNIEDAVLVRDRARASAVKQERTESAQQYFREHAAEWDKIRSLHLSEKDVEASMSGILGSGPFETLVDLGTGTGRMLELFAPYIQKGIGIDMNPDMLAYARSKLDDTSLHHCQVRYGDLSHVPLDNDCADVVILHQVLHFFDDPIVAIREAERILKVNGKLLVVDFAPHELEFLREDFAHIRLGFGKDYLEQCIKSCDLKLIQHKDLVSPNNSEKKQLTVSIWLAEKEQNASSAHKSNQTGSLSLEKLP